MKTANIFNPSGDDSLEGRKLWDGDSTGILQLNSVRYKWASALYRKMRENFWTPEVIDMSKDVSDYRQLTPDEQNAYKGILSYLIYLDSIQTVNLPHLKLPITAPEVSLCLVEHLSQEGLHAHSYQYCVESVLPVQDRPQIYDFWRLDPVLRSRSQEIANPYQEYLADPTPRNYLLALLADYLLEGLYFHSGFTFYYILSSRHLMSGTADMIRLIHRDEETHVRLMLHLLLEAIASNLAPLSVEDVHERFERAVNCEREWILHITQNRVLGIDERPMTQYLQYLANLRLGAMKFPPLYPSVSNPYQHLSRISSGEQEVVRADFFETSVTNYVQPTAISGWDF